MLAMAVAQMDRQLLAVIQEPIKRDLHLSDSQLGLLTGLCFALFYSAFGIPVGRLSDRWPRRFIVAASMVAWSIMTGLSGAAASFALLALARMGVAVGEAGIVPAGASVIAEQYASRQRAAAMSFFMIGSPLGMLLGFLGGSRLEQAVGWRMTFVLAAIPGLLLAGLVLWLVREPDRKVASEPIRLWAGIRVLAGHTTLRYLLAAVVLSTIVAYAPMSWAASYLIRTHSMPIAEVGLALALAYGLGGAIGIFGSGLAADRLAVRDVRWYLWTPAIVTALIAPFLCAALLAPNGQSAVLFLLAPCAFGLVYAGLTITVWNMIAPPRFRGTATAIYMLSTNIIGVGIGNWSIGLISDLLAPTQGSASIKYALLIVVPAAAILAAVHYTLAARTLPRELARINAGAGAANDAQSRI